jgi:hypothetical protein
MTLRAGMKTVVGRVVGIEARYSLGEHVAGRRRETQNSVRTSRASEAVRKWVPFLAVALARGRMSGPGRFSVTVLLPRTYPKLCGALAAELVLRPGDIARWAGDRSLPVAALMGGVRVSIYDNPFCSLE